MKKTNPLTLPEETACSLVILFEKVCHWIDEDIFKKFLHFSLKFANFDRFGSGIRIGWFGI